MSQKYLYLFQDTRDKSNIFLYSNINQVREVLVRHPNPRTFTFSRFLIIKHCNNMVSNRMNIENQQRSSTLPWYFMYPFRTTEWLGIYSTYKMPKCGYWAQSPNKTEQNAQKGTNRKKTWSWKSQWANNVCLKNNIVYWYTSPNTGIYTVYCTTQTPLDPYLSLKAYLSIKTSKHKVPRCRRCGTIKIPDCSNVHVYNTDHSILFFQTITMMSSRWAIHFGEGQ